MKILIFSGTTEGHALCRFLSSHAICAQVFVATTYGEAVMEPLTGITVHAGRLTTLEMAAYMSAQTIVVDATHPYACEVTEHIQEACQIKQAEYLRLLRPVQQSDGVEVVADTAQAVNWLCQHQGNILLTTGSKELDAYTAIPEYQKRIFPRVLPSVEAIEKCMALGFPCASILAMQGPFSHEMNVALLKKVKASILVTKDTGKNGGFAEKLSAAKELGVTTLVIARPTQENGFTLEQIQLLLLQRMECCARYPRFPLFISLAGKKVVVIGGGKIAARRIHILQHFGCELFIISPELSPQISCEDIHYFNRTFQPQDIQDATLVIAATNERKVNQQIAHLCYDAHIPVSVADCAQESTFYFPAICEGQGLIAGLVSDGSNHRAVATTAKKIRKLLE